MSLFNEEVPIEAGTLLPQHIGYTEALTLPHDKTSISFEFAALNYRVAEKSQYAYMLEGFEEDWTYVDSSQRVAKYTQLHPGTYALRVIASNNDGV